MSLMIRERIAVALSAAVVDWDEKANRLDGQPYRPASLAIWQAFPDLQSVQWLSQCVIEHTWAVYVILPASDPQAWATATDAALEPVRDQLIKLGNVDRVEPIALVAADQALTMPALNFTLIT